MVALSSPVFDPAIPCAYQLQRYFTAGWVLAIDAMDAGVCPETAEVRALLTQKCNKSLLASLPACK